MIRLKNLFRTAEERLLENGLRLPDAQQLLEPAHRLVEDESLWQQAGDGLALFLAPDWVHPYWLPLRFEAAIYVGRRIYLRPLLPLLQSSQPFYILALSQNEVRLFQADRHTIGQVALSGVPSSLAEALSFDEPEKQMQVRAGAPVGSGRMAGMFYNSGDGGDDAKERLSRYFHLVDDGLCKLLGPERLPLVLAGVDYLLPLYRAASQYTHIVPGAITGNRDRLSPEGLHRQACAMLQPYFRKDRQEAVAQFRQSQASRRASDNIRLILPAAYRGRVAVLFVAQRRAVWGRFEPESNHIQLRPGEAKRGDDDLADLAAFHTLRNGGVVYAVEAHEMPEVAPLAAIFRY